MSLPCGCFNRNYTEEKATFRTKTHWGLLIGLLVLLFAFPMFLSESWLSFFSILGITVIVALGLQILTGYAGQISLGQSAFMGVGAYASAILVSKIGLPFWGALPLAGIIAGVIGIIFGAPSLRIKGLYLAISTIAAQFILYWIFSHWDYCGGWAGIAAPRPSIGNFTFDSEQSYYYIILVVALLALFSARNMARGRVGRAFIAIRDNEIAADGIGVNIFSYKLLAFFIGCFFAGIGGSLYAHYSYTALFHDFTLMQSIWYLGMVVIGGLGSIVGTVFGVIFINILTELTTLAAPNIPFISEIGAASLSLLAFGLAIVLFLIFEPRGLAHRWELFKKSYRLFPLSY